MRKPCAQCNTPFIASRSDAVTCSSKCRQKAYRDRRSAIRSKAEWAQWEAIGGESDDLLGFVIYSARLASERRREKRWEKKRAELFG